MPEAPPAGGAGTSRAGRKVAAGLNFNLWTAVWCGAAVGTWGPGERHQLVTGVTVNKRAAEPGPWKSPIRSAQCVGKTRGFHGSQQVRRRRAQIQAPGAKTWPRGLDLGPLVTPS